MSAAVLVLATFGAFATAKNTVLDQVFYDNGPACVEARATVCEYTGSPACAVEVFNLDETTSLGIQQIYAAQSANPAACQTAYRSTPQ